jgi:hypothetical protein
MLRLLATTALAVVVDTAAAQDASCKRANARQEHTFKAFVPIEGVGAVAWRATMDVRARDRCNHGALTVTYSWQNGRKPDPSGTPPTATPPDGGTTRPPTAQFGEGGGT